MPFWRELDTQVHFLNTVFEVDTSTKATAPVKVSADERILFLYGREFHRWREAHQLMVMAASKPANPNQ